MRQQRHVLEERREVIDRAIRALETAETNVEASPGSAEVWDAWRLHYEAWPSEEWRTLYRDVNAMLDGEPSPDPLSAQAQALGSRWIALDTAETTVGAIRTGLRKAWADREHWPQWMRERLAAHRVDRAIRFIDTVLWERWEIERTQRERTGHAAPARVSDARIGLYRDCAAAVAVDPASETAQHLVTRWRTILDAECLHDAATVREQIQAWRGRRQWSPAMVRYMASCYAMDADTWRRAADFLEAAYLQSCP